MDYSPIENGEMKWFEFSKNLTKDDLRKETNRLYDLVRGFFDELDDHHVIFLPHDPEAYDPHAETEAERHVGWTLGHLVAHVTASVEESASISSILARGIVQQGRLRSEIPWEELDTVEKCLQRLDESRRMALGYLDAWPDKPSLKTFREINSERARAHFGPMNATASFMTGLTHMHGHLGQFADVRQQATEAVRA